jgi:Flp pilus assembly pilin Flp
VLPANHRLHEKNKKPASHTGRVSFYRGIERGNGVRFFKKFFSGIYSFVDDCRGATAIEYTLMVAAIAVAIFAVIFAFGDQLRELIVSLPGILTAG